jgi:hypothetical protein
MESANPRPKVLPILLVKHLEHTRLFLAPLRINSVAPPVRELDTLKLQAEEDDDARQGNSRPKSSRENKVVLDRKISLSL